MDASSEIKAILLTYFRGGSNVNCGRAHCAPMIRARRHALPRRLHHPLPAGAAGCLRRLLVLDVAPPALRGRVPEAQRASGRTGVRPERLKNLLRPAIGGHPPPCPPPQ